MNMPRTHKPLIYKLISCTLLLCILLSTAVSCARTATNDRDENRENANIQPTEPEGTEYPGSRYEGKTIVSAEVFPKWMAITCDYPYASPRVGIGGSGTYMSILQNGYTDPRILNELKKQNASPEVINMAKALYEPDFENNVIFYIGISVWEKGDPDVTKPTPNEILTRETERLQGLGYDVELKDGSIRGYLTKDQIFNFPPSEIDTDLEYLIGLVPLFDDA